MGKDRNEIFRGTIHSSFRLGETNGGFIALVAPDGVTILDQVADYAKQRLGRMYGRDAGGQWAYFAEGKPGEPNQFPARDFVKDTKFSIDRGFHKEPFDLVISSTTEGAVIH